VRTDAPDFDSLERKSGYRFRNRDLLFEAVTHKSYHHEHPEDAPSHNERLEFLGDSVLGLSVVDFLFSLEEKFDEATMSKIKSYVVKKAVLSELAVEMGLGSYLRIGKGEEDTGGRKKMSILSDAMEALIGAVYRDGGFEEARRFVVGLLGSRIDRAVVSRNYHDYKTELQEKGQMKFGVLPEYRLVSEEGREHQKLFTVEVFVSDRKWGTGTGGSKKEAQQRAAKEALKNLGL